MRARGPLQFSDNDGKQFSLHPQVDAISCRFYSCDNVTRIQDACESRGWGRPAQINLKPFMDYVLAYEPNQYSRDMMPPQQYEQYLANTIWALNQRVMSMIEPYIGPAKLRYAQHQRHLMGLRALPPVPQMECPGNVKDIELTYPYYNHLE
jgi:hypothetical protein